MTQPNQTDGDSTRSREINYEAHREPNALALAAIEFQVCALLNDQHSTLNFNGRECVVNELGDFQRKYATLRRIARWLFPDRNDYIDVLDETIHDYSLWGWADPCRFWIAYKRDMFDAAKKYSHQNALYLDDISTTRSGDALRQSRAASKLDRQIVQDWTCDQQHERRRAELFRRLELAKSGGSNSDRLIAGVTEELLADTDYMADLGASQARAANLAGVVMLLRSKTGCSQSGAYRLLDDFRKHHGMPRKS